MLHVRVIIFISVAQQPASDLGRLIFEGSRSLRIRQIHPVNFNAREISPQIDDHSHKTNVKLSGSVLLSFLEVFSISHNCIFIPFDTKN
jgi:hypothetical protein